MKINKKIKIMIPVFLIFTIVMIIIGVLIYKKINNSYAIKIKNAFLKTLDASSAGFEFEYINNEEKIEAVGNIEYDFEELVLLGNADSNIGALVINVEKGNSDVGYFLEKFNYWITFDITDTADEVLSFLENFGKEKVEDSFPVQTVLKFFKLDDKLNIEKYPNKLSNSFLIKFVSKGFMNKTLKYEEENIDGITTYTINPDIYDFLEAFITSSKISGKDKKELLSNLEKNKSKLDKINLKISISIDKNGYIKDLYYYQDDNTDITSMKIDLNNMNNVKVEIEEEVLNKLKEE